MKNRSCQNTTLRAPVFNQLQVKERLDVTSVNPHAVLNILFGLWAVDLPHLCYCINHERTETQFREATQDLTVASASVLG